MGTIRSAIQIYDGMSPAFRSMNNAMNMVLSSFEAVQAASGKAIDNNSIKAARDELNKAEIAISQIEQEIQQAEAAQKGFNSQLNQGSGLMGKLRTLAISAGAAFSAKQIIDLADTMTSTNSRLNLINDGLQTTSELQDMILASANRSRASYMDTASVVSKLGVLAGNAFSSNEEMIAFTELMNKNFVIGGSSIQEQSAAMYQLTQAMAAGRLQGDEFRSIMENAPLLAQSIAEYMGLSVGELREMSSQGLITADVIKGALFASAEDVNARFAEMPMTFAQIGTILSNTMLQIFEPVIQAIGRGAQWIYDNWANLEPVFWGLAAAVGAYAAITAIKTAIEWHSVAANQALVTAMLANPALWVAMAIGVLIGIIYKWVQSVGGIQIAWMMAMDAIQTATGNAKVFVLEHLENMINGAIDKINAFIALLNQIPGVNIDAIAQVSFAANAAAENEAAKVARRAEIDAARAEAEKRKLDNEAGLEWESLMSNSEAVGYMGDTAANTAAMKDSMETSEEELKYLREIAEQEAINRFTTAAITIEMTNNNQINSEMDLDGVVTALEDRLWEAAQVISEGVHE